MSLLEKYHPRTVDGIAKERLEPELAEDDRFDIKAIIDYYDG